ncbi:MAG: hypothetical protein E7523_03985 [Ruminococcaceae bacterium]|nr:hypothetical protein [Oscillospiraceae bacterium]
MENKKTENDYRAERKARLAKNAAKGKNKTLDTYKLVKGVLCVICAVLVVAAAVGVCFAYGIPQRLLPAVTVGDRTYSIAEYEYYYATVYGTHAQQSYEAAQQYGSPALLAALGQYDYSVHPEKQSKTEGEETITWAAFFDKYIIDMFQTYEYYFAQCKELGIELDEVDMTEIDEAIASMQSSADMYSVSLNRFLGSYYGNGMTEKLYRETLKDQKLAEKYLTHIEETNEAAVTDEAIQAAYDADPTAYQVADLRVFGFSADGSSVTGAETESTENTVAVTDGNVAVTDGNVSVTDGDVAPENEILKKAEEFCNRITDEQSFIDLAVEYATEADKETFKNESATVVNAISKSIVSTNISEELAEWLFAEGRAQGDKHFVEADDGDYIYVVYVTKPAYREDRPKVDVRHILVSYETGVNHMDAHTEEGTEHTADEAAIFAADVAKAVEEFGLTVDYDFALAQNEKYTQDVVNATYSATYDIYETYLENATETNFAELADKYSADTSSTVATEDGSTGGMYEDVAKGSMVANFDNWIYDENRTAGDVGIVQTEYGFHIIYFVAENERSDWEDSVVASLTSETTETFNTMLEEIAADDSNVKFSAFKNYAYNKSIELIEKIYGGNYFTVE